MRAKLARWIIAPVIDDGDWNLLAVARQRMTREATRALAPLVRMRASGYPRVLVGMVRGDGPVAGLVEAAGGDPKIGESLVRIQPMDTVSVFERDDVTEALCVVLQPHAHLFAGKCFHVRARLRGMKGRLETPAVERALGAFLLDQAELIGTRPKVGFDDPDLVLGVEVVGRRAGFSLMDRELRAHPLVRVR
ncbi:MAG: THUMP domain-containing protein [Deltaproteobacteria bacterium]